MHKRLHSHLRDGLVFEEPELSTEALAEKLPNDCYDPDARAAKRQRVETIAHEYLRRGRFPTLLSTCRIPLDRRWIHSRVGRGSSIGLNNNWKHEQVENKAHGTAQIAKGDNSGLVNGSTAVNKEVNEDATLEFPCHTTLVSDTAGIGGNQDDIQGRGVSGLDRGPKPGQDAIEDVDITAQIPRPIVQGANSGTSLIFNADTGPRRSGRSKTSSKQWLKRRDDQGGNPEHPGHGFAGGSPTPPGRALGVRNYRKSGSASPGARASAGNASTYISVNQLRSSASASMDISSPPRFTAIRQADQINLITTPTLENQQPQERNSDPSLLGLEEIGHLATEERDDATMSGGTPTERRLAGPETQDNPPFREDIRRMAERCAQLEKPSAEAPKKRKGKQGGQKNAPPEPVDNATSLNSPPPQASFTYKKVGNRKPTKAAPKRKYRAVSFDSPPVPPKDDKTDDTNASNAALPNAEQQDTSPPSKKHGHSPRPDIYDVVTAEDSIAEFQSGRKQRESLASDRQSIYSTQAAMLLAQQEFQEGTLPSILASSTSQPHPQTDTPNHNPRDSQPAITPFHTFNAALDKRVPAPSISTQDLFNAASPFTFSTIKKKSTAPIQRSNLRFSVHSSTEERSQPADPETCKSPTPSADRIPLKARNGRVPFKSASEKGTQESLKSSPLRSGKTMDVSGVEFSPPLSQDLSFAERFLGNLDGGV